MRAEKEDSLLQTYGGYHRNIYQLSNLRSRILRMASMVFTAKNSDSILLRPAAFADFWIMAALLVSTHAGSILERFLCPFRKLYPNDALRASCQRIVLRWLNPQNITCVACLASCPKKPIGFIQFQRIGDDEGAKRQIASRQTTWLKIQSWYFRAKFHIINSIWPDQSVDQSAKKGMLLRFKKSECGLNHVFAGECGVEKQSAYPLRFATLLDSLRT
jgi:hypothetical protein